MINPETGQFSKGPGPPLDMRGKLGSVSLQFGEPITLSAFAKDHAAAHLRRLGSGGGHPDSNSGGSSNTTATASVESVVADLAYSIIDRLHATSVCHGTHLVAAILLMYRDTGGVRFLDLERDIRWLFAETQARGLICHLSPRHATQWSTSVRRALGLLHDCVVEVRPGMFAPGVPADDAAAASPSRTTLGSSAGLSANLAGTHWIKLSIFRNKLIPVFYSEALWSCAVHGLSRNARPGGVPLADLVEETAFLDALFAREFIRNRSREADTRGRQMDVLRSMCDPLIAGRGQILSHDTVADCVRVAAESNGGSQMHAFLCSLVWPFLDGYYAAALGLFSLVTQQRITRTDLVVRMQWLAEALIHGRGGGAGQAIRHYEACSLDLLRNALRTFEDMGIVRKCSAATPGLGPTGLVELTPEFRSQESLQRWANRIGRLRKYVEAPSGAQQALGVTPSLMAELPMLMGRKARL